MDNIMMHMMIHGGTLDAGGRKMWFVSTDESWIVEGYRNRYDQPTLYRGESLETALKTLRDGKMRYNPITKTSHE